MEIESKNPKINLYVQRDFSTKITDSFLFVRENWKLLLKYFITYMLPFSILQTYFMNGYVDAAMTDIAGASTLSGSIFSWTYLGLLVTSVLGSVVACSLFYTLFFLYQEREERLGGIGWQDIRPVFVKFVGRSFILMGFLLLVFILFVAAMVFLASLTTFTLLFTTPLFFACIVPLALFFPAYYLNREDEGIGAVFVWSFRRGFRFWGGTFLVMLVCYLVMSVIGGIFSIPWYAIYFTKVFLGVGSIASENVVMNLVQYVLGVLMILGTYLSLVFQLLGITFQYGHVCEKTEAVTVDADIENFDKV